MTLLLLIIPAISLVTTGTTTLVLSILNFLHLLWIMILFDSSGTTYQFQYDNFIGLDGISLWLVWLVNIIKAIVILNDKEKIG